jgi:hypothetical protein
MAVSRSGHSVDQRSTMRRRARPDQRVGYVPTGASLVATVFAVAVVVGLNGCVRTQPEMRIPTTIGVVTRVDQVPRAGQALDVQLDTGAQVTLDLASANVLAGVPAVGVDTLLITGSDASGLWLLDVPRKDRPDLPPGCFQLLTTGIGHDGWIDMVIGVRLQKSAAFDPGPVSNDQYETETYGFCLDKRGEVISYGPW